jgi:cytoskeletal protein CcmA (bactofilin family)
MKIPHDNTVSLSTLDEDLEISDDVTINCTGEGSTLVVNGDIECVGRASFNGSVKCQDFEGNHGFIKIDGSLECTDLEIKHDAELEVSNDIRAEDVEVDRVLRVGQTIVAREIEVGGTFETTNVKADSVSVGGVFEAKGEVTVEKIEVGGKLEIGGKINSRNLSVGGKAALRGGGSVTDEIEVGGYLNADASLEYGRIEVGGTARLRGTAKGGEIDVGGTFEVGGDLQFTEMDVGGYVEVRGDAIGESIDLGGRLSIGKRLQLSGQLDIGGAIDIGGDAEAQDVEIGGDFKAASLKVKSVQLSGGARTEKGVFATEDVRIEHRSRVHGWIRAMREIEIESRCEVDSVSAKKVILDDHSRARNVYGEEVELGDHAEIAGELMYTKLIRTGNNVRFGKQPEKVSEIPQEKSWIVSPSS